MGSVLAWAVPSTDGGTDLAEISVLKGGEEPDIVELELNDYWKGSYKIELTPKQARELARDLNAAAREAGAKR